MSPSEADRPTDSALCSSSLKMQQSACNYSLKKDKDTPEKEWHLGEGTEQPQYRPENSNSDSVAWKHPATKPLGCMGKTELSQPEVDSQSLGASPLSPLRSLSKSHCENQGNLLQFDRQAPGRISTSPTLRRLRGSSCGTFHSLPQQETLEGPTWGSWKEPAGSPCYFFKNLPGSPNASSHSMLSSGLHSKLPLDPKRALKAADSFKPQTGPTDEDVLPMFQPIEEESLPQTSLPERGGHSLPASTIRLPRPQREELHRSSPHHGPSDLQQKTEKGAVLVPEGRQDYSSHHGTSPFGSDQPGATQLRVL